jgi:hypothetical protein
MNRSCDLPGMCAERHARHRLSFGFRICLIFIYVYFYT